MTSLTLPPELHVPRIKWRESWFNVSAIILSFVVFLYPGLAESNYAFIRLGLGGLLLAAPILIPLTIWVVNWIQVIFQRTRSYPDLRQRAVHAIDDLQVTRRENFSLLQKIAGAVYFDIKRVQYNGGNLLIAVDKPRSPELQLDDLLQVVDTNDGMPMGRFRVIDIRNDEYYATSDGRVDSVWMGFVSEQGETTIQPFLRAIYVLEESGNE